MNRSTSIDSQLLRKLRYKPRFFNAASALFRTHYDTLKVKRNSSSKEIRAAFIELSKKNHPDVNKSSAAHTEFLKIQEAYSVLGKPESRRMYDLGLSNPSATYANRGKQYQYYREPHIRNPWEDPSFYRNRNKTKDKNCRSGYYGIDGMERLPNSIIAGYCFFITIIMFGIQMFAIKHSLTLRRDKMQHKSDEAQALLDELQEVARENGKEHQLELLRQNLEESRRSY
ncbi:dnaJ-like protein 60 [Cylas formicarius]|uniref:dnaJ-like protein 60 n=1 Tax=Cylas formicarius TaxID=197179 RepID=UPI002958DB95|nr:dnaJ-like protein 60 [Cylas formicarius]